MHKKVKGKTDRGRFLIYCMANDTTEAGHYTAIMRGGGGGVELMDFFQQQSKNINRNRKYNIQD